jgi:hypothetical protein
MIWSTDDGMCLCSPIKEAFDSACFDIAPDREEVRVVILDASYSSKDSSLTPIEKSCEPRRICILGFLGSSIGRTHLKKRLAERCLYFHFLMSLFSRRLQDVLGWEHGCGEFPNQTSAMALRTTRSSSAKPAEASIVAARLLASAVARVQDHR